MYGDDNVDGGDSDEEEEESQFNLNLVGGWSLLLADSYTGIKILQIMGKFFFFRFSGYLGSVNSR